MRNILIVVPRFINETGQFYQFPLGLAYIAASIKRAGYNVHGLNLNYVENITQSIETTLIRNNIDFVMCGGLSPFISSVSEIFNISKHSKPTIINIVGGGVLSGDPVTAFGLLNVDYGVIGEGEETIVELLNELQNQKPNLDKVKGITYKKEGQIVQTPSRSAIKNIDELPWPLLEIFNIDRHLDEQTPFDHYFFPVNKTNSPRCIDIITSRSCPFMCTFCFHPVGKTYRERNVDDVINEIKYYKERYHINMVAVLDELFSLRRKRLLEFCEKIRPLNLQWMVQLHVRTADHETLKAMKEAGCAFISYGIESVNNDVLHSMQKKTTRQEIEQALELTYKHQIGIQGNFIFGDTEESIETANECMQWWAKNRKFQVWLSKIQVFPGSPDYIMAVRDNLIIDRRKFLLKLPSNVNISKLNNTNASAMFFILKVHNRTLLHLVPATFRLTNKTVNITLTCQRCEAENHYQDIKLNSEHQHFIRVFCRNCLSRNDIINELFQQDNTISGNNALLGGGSTLDNQPINMNPAQDGAISQDCELEYKHPDLQLTHVGIQLLDDPFNISHHYEFSKELLRVGSVLGAKLHLEQAFLLKKLFHESDKITQGFIDDKKIETLYEHIKDENPIWLTSISDSQPPFRTSRSHGGYVNKDEPDFPDFEGLQVSRKQKIVKIANEA
ncbi:MAG: B12-binding domain-containing radical SAM protein [Gammaproteobacteria bacterium]|nr:B12-binding domain-containing radical SAM protein [Gammaproteobacteria bacterium]